MKPLLLCLLLLITPCFSQEWKLPVATSTRQSVEEISLTNLGLFGMMRKERPGIPAHHHTGIDIMRPDSNYSNQPVFPAAAGEVISVREDGPYGQVIIEHYDEDHEKVWTLYEHVGGILVSPEDKVFPDFPIARFFTREELDRYGWQFDHIHFEIIKKPLHKVNPGPKLPDRHYRSYTLDCLSEKQLERYMFDPVVFFRNAFGETIGDTEVRDDDKTMGKRCFHLAHVYHKYEKIFSIKKECRIRTDSVRFICVNSGNVVTDTVALLNDTIHFDSRTLHIKTFGDSVILENDSLRYVWQSIRR